MQKSKEITNSDHVSNCFVVGFLKYNYTNVFHSVQAAIGLF